jgi:hypothetical protein
MTLLSSWATLRLSEKDVLHGVVFCFALKAYLLFYPTVYVTTLHVAVFFKSFRKISKRDFSVVMSVCRLSVRMEKLG